MKENTLSLKLFLPLDNRSPSSSIGTSSFKPWLPLGLTEEGCQPLEYYLIDDLGGEMVEESPELIKRLRFWDELIPFSRMT